ncbi:Fic family protein [Candidatus Uhrbacteria bacterium]|nr:Fic family protein [Candidatus Uhrbacteria bacterium]
MGIRQGLVGITGSKYRPLDNRFQIREALESLSKAIGGVKTPYDKALLTLLGVSYIQPFEDGNKRTARLAANAVLLTHDCAPLSYRSVSLERYREASLTFHEINAIGPFRKIFVEQYLFAAENYALDA